MSVEQTSRHDMGGDIFTRIVVQYLAEEFQRKWKLDPLERYRSHCRLISAAETCKNVLSTLTTGHAFIESLYEGFDLNVNLSRARYESLINSQVTTFVQPVKELLAAANVDAASIDRIILCGGTCKTPRLQKSITDLFPNAELLNSLYPDEVISIGAAKQAGYILESGLESEELQLRTFEVPTLDADVWINCTKLNFQVPLLSVLTPLPFKHQSLIPTSNSQLGESSSLEFEVHQVTLSIPKQLPVLSSETLLSKVSLNNLVKDPKIVLNVYVDENGLLELNVQEKTNRLSETLELQLPSVGQPKQNGVHINGELEGCVT